MASVAFYIQDRGVFYYLDATLNVEHSDSGRLTSNPTQSGQIASDNYINDPRRLSFSGSISDIKSVNTEFASLSTTEYLDGLSKAKVEKRPVVVSYRADKEPEGDWFITSISSVQNNRKGVIYPTGSTSGPVMAYSITITLQKALLAQAASYEIIPDITLVDSTQIKRSSSNFTQEAPAEDAATIAGREKGKRLADFFKKIRG